MSKVSGIKEPRDFPYSVQAANRNGAEWYENLPVSSWWLIGNV